MFPEFLKQSFCEKVTTRAKIWIKILTSPEPQAQFQKNSKKDAPHFTLYQNC